MRERDGKPVDADDVNGLRDALRAAGVREVQLINSATRQIESNDKLEATASKLETTFAKVADEIPKLTGAITKLIDLLGASTVPVTRGALADADVDVTPGGRKPTSVAGTRKAK